MGGIDMSEHEWLAERFEEHRTHLKAVAYRMLGSLAEADEAVQDAWLRVSRSGAEGIENFRGWLTTIVARVCLNALQARKAKREDLAAVHVPDPIIGRDAAFDAEHEVLLADSVGLALQIVLDTLPPAERLAFVLHDMFDVPFDEIAAMVGRSSTAARQLASRARRRVKGASLPTPDPDLARQRRVVDAFFAAARGGDFDALVAVLDPDVVLRSDGGERRPAGSFVRRGATDVAKSALAGALPSAVLRPALVNGAVGVVVMVKEQPFAVMGFTVTGDKIVEIDVVFDPDRLARLDLAQLDRPKI
jgi:RNA polymerase sigma-70 factor (ECF subfamily)